jgi:hypothetical protein
MGNMNIAFLLSDGFAARMMLRTGIAIRLRREGARVTVVSGNADEVYFQEECKQDGILLRQTGLSAHRIAGWFRSRRAYFLDDVRNNAAFRVVHRGLFKDRWAYGFTMQLINRTLARSYLFREAFKAFERCVNRSAGVQKLLEELAPDLLVLPNPFGAEETVYLLHARKLGIPVVCPILSWDNVTSKGTPLLMPDYFISWGPIMTDEVATVYQFPRERIYECGVPHFDVYRQKSRFTTRRKLLERLNLPPELPYIFYGMVAAIHCPNEIEILAWLAEQINNNAFAEPCSLVIRPHPQTISGVYASSSDDLQKLKALSGPRVALDPPSIRSERLAWDLPKQDMYHLAGLLAECAMCLNASSTLCLDACMLDRPVIDIAFDGWEELPYDQSARKSLDYIHMTKLLAFGGVRVARSFGALKENIDLYLSEPSLDRARRRLSVEQECGPKDGRAAERVASVLLNLAKRQPVSLPESVPSTAWVCR